MSAIPVPYPSLPPSQVELGQGPVLERFRLNTAYLTSLRVTNLLANHYTEAGLDDAYLHALRSSLHGTKNAGDDRHWGWETPGHQLRGHFLGHWLSAAARVVAATGNAELRARIGVVLHELERCQEENGGEWVFAIPPDFLDRIAAGRKVWAPHYNIHKTLMGLLDTAALLGDERALRIADRAGGWFHRWSGQFDRDRMDDILDVETGGMLEVWADLCGATGEERYLDLMRRYRRGRLFDRLVAGDDVLTGRHANTTIPEVLGAARAYEVTGDPAWWQVVAAYWRSAVTERGAYCTGGQTNGEAWTPPFRFAEYRGIHNQEHCTVYNMMRLADFLFRHTGEATYLDYLERNTVNGVLAQQNPETGMIAYYLAFEGGRPKLWGHPTYDFWCCHGTLVQAGSRHGASLAYRAGDDGLVIAQYTPATITVELNGVPTTVRIEVDTVPRGDAKADGWLARIRVSAATPVHGVLRLRIPDWVLGTASARTGGEVVVADAGERFLVVDRTWDDDEVELRLPTVLRAEPIPDEPSTVAFLYGPTVLAGLGDGAVALVGEPERAAELLTPHNRGGWWTGPRFRSTGQARAISFIPLHEVVDEPFSIYFPVNPVT